MRQRRPTAMTNDRINVLLYAIYVFVKRLFHIIAYHMEEIKNCPLSLLIAIIGVDFCYSYHANCWMDLAELEKKSYFLRDLTKTRNVSERTARKGQYIYTRERESIGSAVNIKSIIIPCSVGPAIRRNSNKPCNFHAQTFNSPHNSVTADDDVIFTAQHNFPHNFVIKITLYSHKPMQPMFVTAR